MSAYESAREDRRNKILDTPSFSGQRKRGGKRDLSLDARNSMVFRNSDSPVFHSTSRNTLDTSIESKTSISQSTSVECSPTSCVIDSPKQFTTWDVNTESPVGIKSSVIVDNQVFEADEMVTTARFFQNFVVWMENLFWGSFWVLGRGVIRSRFWVILSHFGVTLGHFWAILGSVWVSLGSFLGHLGVILGSERVISILDILSKPRLKLHHKFSHNPRKLNKQLGHHRKTRFPDKLFKRRRRPTARSPGD